MCVTESNNTLKPNAVQVTTNSRGTTNLMTESHPVFNDYKSSRNTTQGSVFRPIITPFQGLCPSCRQQCKQNTEAANKKKQEATRQRGSTAINPNQPLHSPLSRPECAFCRCSMQSQSRPVYDNVPGGHHFPAPGMTRSERAETLTTAVMHRVRSNCGVRQSRAAPHHSVSYHTAQHTNCSLPQSLCLFSCSQMT